MVIRKTLVTTSLCGLLFAGMPGTMFGHPGTTSRTQASQDQQTPQQATKSITGKVTDIGDQGHSFTVETDGSKTSMKFVVDKSTQVQGHVKVGSVVAVDYAPTDDGQLLCVKVAEQNG